MSERVETYHVEIYSDATKTGVAASSLQLSVAAQRALNHQTGYLLGGQRIWQYWDGSSTSTSGGAWRYYSYRHPNTNHEVFAIKVRVTGKGDATISAQSGTGAWISQQIYAGAGSSSWDEWIFLRTAYDGSDSGYQPITLSLSDCAVLSLTVLDMPREELDAGENVVESYDTTYPRIGLREEEVIAESATAGPEALISETSDGWDNYKRSLISWATTDLIPVPITAAAYAPVFTAGSDDVNFWVRARQKRAETSNYARAYVYSEAPAGTTYSLKVTSTNPGAAAGSSVATATLTSADDGWQEITSLAVDCTTSTAVQLEARRISGSGDVDISAFTLLEG